METVLLTVVLVLTILNFLLLCALVNAGDRLFKILTNGFSGLLGSFNGLSTVLQLNAKKHDDERHLDA